MSITHRLHMEWILGSEKIEEDVDLTGEGGPYLEVSVPASTTNKEVACAFTISALKSFFLLATGDLTMEINDPTTPPAGGTYTIVANKPMVWYDGCGIANPFPEAVTVVYLTNADPDNAVTVYIRVLGDTTP